MRSRPEFPFDAPASPVSEAADLAARLDVLEQQIQALAGQVARLSGTGQGVRAEEPSPMNAVAQKGAIVRSRVAEAANHLLADTLSAAGVVAATGLRVVSTLVQGAAGVVRCYLR